MSGSEKSLKVEIIFKSLIKSISKQNTHIYIYIYIYIFILSNAKSVDGGNNSILGFSFFNIHVIQK